ncbi:hypothetical protein BDV36DRAFT_311304 [Aspergillus pseudocaelatus]|uniref:Uncharacterized protein n=1 Tax=Aspergillus pseudocaelatus TaxID=1825620 RepID=A0ABQ6WEL8_9EURO|nr:hypothetical protein BDV36DRAFT_311304 [Aspergillus pseudocaelatus]
MTSREVRVADLYPPPLYLARCPSLHSPPSYKSQDQEGLQAQNDPQESEPSKCLKMKEISGKVVSGAYKAGHQIVKTTGAILCTVFTMFKQFLKWMAIGICRAGKAIIRILWFLIFWSSFIIWSVLLGAVCAAVPLGILGGIGYFIYWAITYNWVWIVDARVPGTNCTWYFNGFHGPESLAYHWLWVNTKNFIIREGWYEITLHPGDKPTGFTVSVWPYCPT